jgi:hypothetical protein|eukprot:COSAG06_NODE_3885_length_4804_cov_3.150478_4_plen_266_part_00
MPDRFVPFTLVYYYALPLRVLAVIEELDAANEFFFDSETNELYLWYNTSSSSSSSSSLFPGPGVEVVVPTLDTLIELRGSQVSPVRNVSLVGLTFTQNRPTFFEPRGNPSGGDWAMERLGAVLAEGVEGLRLEANTFTKLDTHAVFLSGYSRNATIERNLFYSLGASAVASWGKPDDVDGTNGDQPRFTKLRGNWAHDLGFIQKQSSLYFQAESCQAEISENICFNIPRCVNTQHCATVCYCFQSTTRLVVVLPNLHLVTVSNWG